MSSHQFIFKKYYFNYLSRISNTSRWIEKTKSELTNNDFIYDFSYSTCANCVCIIQNIL
jgi:hypothetical protein